MTTRISQRREEKLNWKTKKFENLLRSLQVFASLHGGSRLSLSLTHADDNFRLSPHFTYLAAERSVCCRCLNTQTSRLWASAEPQRQQRNQHNWNFSIRDAEWKEQEVVCGKKLKAENLRKIVAAQPSLVLATELRWILRVQVSIALFFLHSNTQREQVIWFLSEYSLLLLPTFFHHASIFFSP